MARKQKENTKVTSAPSLETPSVEVAPQAESTVTETPAAEEVVATETPQVVEAPVVEEVKEETAAPVEVAVAPVKAESLSYGEFKSKLIAKVLKLAPNSFIRTGTADQWVKTLKNKGTLAVTQYGKVVFLNQIAPDRGGKDILNKKYKIREFITDVTTEDLIKNMIEIAKITSLNYTIETDQELEIFNDHNVKLTHQTQAHIENADNEDQKSQPLTKRCGGVTHKTEESRFLPYSRFFKNAGNEDGVNRLCKDCYLTGVYGDKRKVMKVVPIPDHDKSTHKWCNLCESVKEHSFFYKARQTKDGLCANCKACKHQQKIANKEKKEKEKKENTEKSGDTE